MPVWGARTLTYMHACMHTHTHKQLPCIRDYVAFTFLSLHISVFIGQEHHRSLEGIYFLVMHSCVAGLKVCVCVCKCVSVRMCVY